MAKDRTSLIAGVDAALGGDWDTAHETAQAHQGEANADWLHAILHKIEPDPANARYWYGRCGRSYDDYADANEELRALRATLDDA
jgi:hypothetical protein